MPEVVTLDVVDHDADHLRAEVLRLRRRVALLLAMIRLLFTVFRTLGVSLDEERLHSAEGKAKLLAAIAQARPFLKLTVLLGWLGISASRVQRMDETEGARLRPRRQVQLPAKFSRAADTARGTRGARDGHLAGVSPHATWDAGASRATTRPSCRVGGDVAPSDA